jgi:phosphoglycerol transferase
MLSLRLWLPALRRALRGEFSATAPMRGDRMDTGEWPVYAGTAAVCLALLVPFLRLYQADLRVPFAYDGDGIYYLAMLWGILQNGWYLDNPRLGFPFLLDYRDFPVGDGWLHLGVVKAIGWAFPDPAVAFNLFYLLTFPLAGVVALFALRRMGASRLAAAVCAVLFAFLPYHFFRLPHPFLASYYLVPLGALLAVRLAQGGGAWTWGRFLAAVLLGLGGVYFALFTLMFLAVGAAAGAAAQGAWGPARAGALWAAVVAGSLGVTLAPSIHHKLTADANADAPKRVAYESERLALKITQLLLPVTKHRVGFLRDLKERYNAPTTPLVTDNDMASLGLVGSLGFLGLLLWLLLHRPAAGLGVADALMLLTVASVLLATVGGFGSLIAYIASPWVRGYSRISVCIGFFALAAVALAFSWAQARWATTSARRRAFAAGLAAVLVVGLLDQTTPAMAPRHAELKAVYESDRAFARRIEDYAGPGGAVFQLPYRHFPECPPEAGFNAYDLLRPYLHTRHARWTYGGMRGQEGDAWTKGIAALPADALVGRLAEAGMAGVYIDRHGYADRGAAIERQLAGVLAAEPWVSADGRASFFGLGEHARVLRVRCGEAEWEQRRARALHPVLVLWRNGFTVEENFTDKGVGHWCSDSGELHLLNGLPGIRRVTLHWHCDLPGRTVPARLTVESPMGAAEAALDPVGQTFEETFNVPPGKAVVRLRCDAPPLHAPEDAWRRRLVMRVTGVSCLESLQPSEPVRSQAQTTEAP